VIQQILFNYLKLCRVLTCYVFSKHTNRFLKMFFFSKAASDTMQKLIHSNIFKSLQKVLEKESKPGFAREIALVKQNKFSCGHLMLKRCLAICKQIV